MSAFIVSDSTMQSAVSAMHSPRHSCEDADVLGQKLYDMNHKAVQARYPSRGYGATVFKWKPSGHLANGNNIPEDLTTACQWLKALHCLRYQCSEGDVPEMLLYKALEKTIHQFESHLATIHPEYKQAEWD